MNKANRMKNIFKNSCWLSKYTVTFVYKYSLNCIIIHMTALIYITGKIGTDTTLVDVIRQYKSYENPTDVLAIIDSVGGNKEEGDSIYNYLERIKQTIPVNTYAKKAYSISAKIFAVGQEREVDNVDKAVMIHFAWAKPNGGTAEYFEAIAEALREMENEFAAFYSQLLDIDEVTIRNLLDNETFLSGEAAVQFGFATKLKEQVAAVAEYEINNNFNYKKMTEIKKKTVGKALLEAMASFIGSFTTLAELTLQDSNGTDVIFPELEAGSIPKVGDKATVDGQAIPDGSYIMPSLDEATVVFVGGSITEIIEKAVEETQEEAAAESAAEAAKVVPSNVEVKAEEVQQISVWSFEVINTSFTVGDVVKSKGYEGEEYTVGAGEFQIADGRRVVTDATGTIVIIKEANAPNDIAIEPEASFDELLKKVTDKVKTEIQAEFKAEILKKDAEIVSLKSKIGSKEINAESVAPEKSAKTKGSRASEILRAARS